jgi:hypothetical protein
MDRANMLHYRGWKRQSGRNKMKNRERQKEEDLQQAHDPVDTAALVPLRLERVRATGSHRTQR